MLAHMSQTIVCGASDSLEAPQTVCACSSGCTHNLFVWFQALLGELPLGLGSGKKVRLKRSLEGGKKTVNGPYLFLFTSADFLGTKILLP